jgi:ATP-dependent Lon protease
MSEEVSTSSPTRDALDDKVNRHFAGKVVRKDLVRKVKVGSNVPIFVLEYLLGKYCASTDEMSIKMGLEVVNNTLAENYIRPDESAKAQSMVKEKGGHSFIDKVKVRLVDSTYWAESVNFGHKHVQIPDHYVREYDRLLTGGVWAQVDMRWKEDDPKSPFVIDNLDPIQLAAFDRDEFCKLRREFTTDEWIDLMVRSMGYEPDEMDRRRKLLFLMRLVPLCESNFNIVELGPRSTGKSYAIQEISPYAALLTGPTTVANLFGHMNRSRKGMVVIWDVVGFDEVGDLQKMPKEVITTLKTYCESGRFQRGQESMSGSASIALFGNTNQPVDALVETSHLFAPMPEVIRDDMAFIDRLHFYLPGWEMPKLGTHHFTDHYGFVVDFLAEALRDLRKLNYTEVVDRHFSFGSHLNARDRKAARRTISGLTKILHPHGDVGRDDLEEIVQIALEGRRRVKEQLKKMGSFEYHQTSFSYSDKETGEQHFVPVQEQDDRDLVSPDPLPPGAVYAGTMNGEGTVGLYRIEISTAEGTGNLNTAGGVKGNTKESIERAYNYLESNKSEFGVGREIDVTDLHVEVIDLVGNEVEGEVGVAFFVAVFSALKKESPQPALLILGDMSIQGNVKKVRSLIEPLQVAVDTGAKRALIPLESKQLFLEVGADVLENVDPIFYGDLGTATSKALGLN